MIATNLAQGFHHDHPRRPTDFLKYIGTPFEKYVLPIIPPGAALTEKSVVRQDQLGKIPGKWMGMHGGANLWRGFEGWSKTMPPAPALRSSAGTAGRKILA